MRTVGITAEFDPFHEGHKYLIDSVRSAGADRVIAVMSGDFTQRGTPALCSKWERAKAALEGGVDLVIELPAVFACAGASYFAKGASEILAGTEVVDTIAFGSESGDAEALVRAAGFLTKCEHVLTVRIAELSKLGMSYPAAREKAMLEFDKETDTSLISEPNNILAIEYIKAVRKITDNIDFFTVKRSGNSHAVTASKLREEARLRSPERFKRADDLFYKILVWKTLEMSEDDIDQIASASAGLGRKLKKEIRNASSLEKLIELVKSKGFTETRVRRLLTQTVLGITKHDMSSCLPYIRVLAANGTGRELIREITDRADIPVIRNINRERGDKPEHPEISRTLEIEERAVDLFLLLNDKDLYADAEFASKPYIWDEIHIVTA